MRSGRFCILCQYDSIFQGYQVVYSTMVKTFKLISVEHVTIAIMRAPAVYNLIFDAMVTPLSLKKTARKSIWKHLSSVTGGKSIQMRMPQFHGEIPNSLVRYLKFHEI